MVHTAQMAAPFPLPAPHPEQAVSAGSVKPGSDAVKEATAAATSLPQPGITALAAASVAASAAAAAAQQNGRDPPTANSVRGGGGIDGLVRNF